MFYHTETRSLLSVSTNLEDQALKTLSLEKTPSDTTVFKITHNKDLSTDTDEILYDQSIEIFYDKFELFLSKGDSVLNKMEINPSGSYTRINFDFPKVMSRRNPYEFSGHHSAAVLNKVPGEFRLLSFKSNNSAKRDDRTINNGDFIRVRYIDKWLTFYPNQDKKKEVYFESVNDRFQKYNLIHTIFQVLDKNSIKEDPVLLGDSKEYILKHFVTGNYIHFESPTSIQAHPDINKNDHESPYLHFRAETDNPEVTEKLPLRIEYLNKDDYESYLKTSMPVPVKNVQFEINTLYFFGFKVPEEYSYKNQKNLTRVLAELSGAFEIEGYNIVLEKVDSEEMEKILEVEKFANELQILIDLISVHVSPTTKFMEEVNGTVAKLVKGAERMIELMHKVGKINDEEEKEQFEVKKYQLEIIDRQMQALMREFRVFDLMHMINFLLIKKVPKNLEGDAESTKFDAEAFLELYQIFVKILQDCLSENTSNRFYNSQYIRIYIHFMSDSCDGVFKRDNCELLIHAMRRTTLELLKKLLWDDDLDGLGQLNFYQTVIFNAIRNSKNYETYYLELLEHISSSKAYNLINSFRDAFITTFLTSSNSFKAVFPLIIIKPDESIFVEFDRAQVFQVPLSELQQHEEAYNYFVVTLRTVVALSTSKFVTFSHQFIKHYPLSTLQKVLKHPDISVEVKMLVHLIVLYVYFDYMRLPFSFIPPYIQTSSDQLRQILNQEEKKIVEFCKTCIGDFEKTLLVDENISEEVTNNINNLNTQDCSQQINLLEFFLASEPSFQSTRIALFYIQATINNGNITIHFLNKAKEALIRIRKRYQTSEEDELKIIPELLEIFALVNQKMKTHSTIAIYNQVIKSQNPNAEAYSRKIITGLKKIHLESFAPVDMIALNEPIITGVSIKYLKDVGKYEDSIAEELDKFVILSSMKDVENIKETIEIALTLNQNIRKYYVQKEKEAEITMDGNEYVQNLELLEKLLTFIYNPAEHFLFTEDGLADEVPLPDAGNPTARFFRVLRKEKVAYRDQPFVLRPKAISKLQQRIFALLSVQDILLKLLNCTITLTVTNRPPDAPSDVYQARLILVILIAFVYGNKSNQDLLSRSHGFISLYYQQKYIDKSCDTLSLFAEVMRDNEELLEVSKKFIYDITCYTFLGTIKPRAINKDSGAYLCTAIMSMHYLHRADIPLITYDTFSVAENKLDDVLKNEFSNLNLLKKIQEKAGQPVIDIDLPACYYNIRQLLDTLASIVSLSNKEGKKAKVDKFRQKFNCKRIIKGLLNSDYRFQFELKNLFLRCINKVNFSKLNPNTNFLTLEDISSATSLIGYLVNELFEFLLFSPKNKKVEESEKAHEAFLQATDKIETDDAEGEESEKALSLNDVAKNYKEFTKEKLANVRQLIFMDEISVPLIWERLYIFSECWTFLAKLCAISPEIVHTTGLFEFFLAASEQLVQLVDITNFGVLNKLKKYFAIMGDLKQYEQFKEKLREVRESIVAKQESLSQEVDLKENKKQEKVVEDPAEKVILETILDHMRGSKHKDVETNIEMFSQMLSAHSGKRSILTELLTILAYNPLNLHKDVTTFVARFLNLYLRKKLPENLTGFNDISFDEFYKIQRELNELGASKSLAEGILVARNSKNLEEIFKLILTYTTGNNPKVVEGMKKSLANCEYKLLWSNNRDEQHEDIVEYTLEEILKMVSVLNDTEISKFLEYCIRSHKDFAQPTTDEGRGLKSSSEYEQKDILKKKMQSFFQEYANKDKDDVYKELGPLPIRLETIIEVLRVSSDDTASLKIAKNSIIKVVKENGLEKPLLDYFHKRIGNHKEDLDFLKLDGVIALNLLISKIKYGMILSE